MWGTPSSTITLSGYTKPIRQDASWAARANATRVLVFYDIYRTIDRCKLSTGLEGPMSERGPPLPRLVPVRLELTVLSTNDDFA